MIDQSTTPEPLLNSEEHVSEEDRDIKCNSQVLKKLMIDVSLFVIGLLKVGTKIKKKKYFRPKILEYNFLYFSN